MKKSEMPIISFKTTAKWREWLLKHNSNSLCVWLRIFKKASNEKSVSYAEALDEALCFGWIDGQKNTYDPESFLQKFTPRRPKSMWSKRNREHVARLIKEKRMTRVGLKVVQSAKKDGRWDAAYDSPSNAVIPKDFLDALSKNKEAKKFFDTLNKTNRYSIVWRLQTVKKPETRAKRMGIILDMMAQGEKL